MFGKQAQSKEKSDMKKWYQEDWLFKIEVIHRGGDLRNLGGSGAHETTFLCPDGVVLFKLTGECNSNL